MGVNISPRLIFLLAFLFVSPLPAFAGESSQATIDYLIDYVARADVTYIRNGDVHTPAEAVAHIQAKYEHFKADIKTPDDFIRLAASKSLLTGKPYLVRLKDGKEIPMDEWLHAVLKEHRARSGQ